MTPPGEIKMINRDGAMFRAHVCQQRDPVTQEQRFLYNPAKTAFQYRVEIPGVELSLVVVDVTKQQLYHFMKTGRPVLIVPQG